MTQLTQPEQRTIDGCRIERCLGRGGMGEVWLGYEEFSDRWVAFKTIRLEFTANESIVLRFRNEVRACAKIRSNHVVQLYSSGELPEGGYYMRMEFVEGESLADARLRERDSRVPLRKALAWMRDAARGLFDAEKVGIVHRDIKPANLLLHQAGHVLVADFGIAFLSDAATRLTVDNSVPGTALYMAPELFEGEAASVQSDVYSLGATLYQLLSGKPPTEGATLGEIFHHKQKSPELTLRDVDVADANPRDLGLTEALLRRMTAGKPTARPASFGAIVDELDAMLSVGENATVPMPSPGKRRGRGGVLWMVMAAALVVVALLLWKFAGDPPNNGETAKSSNDVSPAGAPPKRGSDHAVTQDGEAKGEPTAEGGEGAAQTPKPSARDGDKVEPDGVGVRQPAEAPPGTPSTESSTSTPATGQSGKPDPTATAAAKPVTPPPPPHEAWIESWAKPVDGASLFAGTALPAQVRDDSRSATMQLVEMPNGGLAYVDLEEVSWQQWDGAGKQRPAKFASEGKMLPARGIDAQAVRAFAKALAVELPTFSQWRQVVYGDGRETPWGSGPVKVACYAIRRSNRERVSSDAHTSGKLQPTNSTFESCRAPFCMLIGNVRELVRNDVAGEAMQVVGVGHGQSLPLDRYARGAVKARAVRQAADDIGFRCLRLVPAEIVASARER